MSWTPATEPECDRATAEPAIALEIAGRARDIGHFEVARVLPARECRAVGPFVFFDRMGPAVIEPNAGIDVRPHPHIGLATVTYLFAGEIFHRDSLGSAQAIRPGAINWMTAGRGIVHSERTPPEARVQGGPLHGLQLWVALPREAEETAPAFAHHPASTVPEIVEGGVRARVLAGTAHGLTSPVVCASPLFYVETRLEPGARVQVPREHEQRAIYVVDGEVRCGAAAVRAGTMAVLRKGADAVFEAHGPTHLVMLGGDALDGPRYVWWNFVSSSKERLEQAAIEWRERRFPEVPGDEAEWIPLPDFPRLADLAARG